MDAEPQSTEEIETENVEQQSEVTLEELQAKIAQLESTNGRLLSESKDNSEKYRALRDKNSAREKIELEQSENWKERLEVEKKEKQDAIEKYNALQKVSLKKDLDFEIAKLIGNTPLNEGVTIDDVIYQVMDTNLIEVNDTESGFNNLADAYAKVKESKQFLFNNPKKPMVNTVPHEGAPKEKVYGKLTTDEKTQLRAKLIKEKYG